MNMHKEIAAILLPQINSTEWNGNMELNRIDECIRLIEMDSNNSGLYNPALNEFKGVIGKFVVNEDATINAEARIIKKANGKFLVEYLSKSAYNQLEQEYLKIIRNEI